MYRLPDDVDEADLEDELAALDEEWDAEGDLEEEATPAYLLPSAPEGKVAENAATDEYGLPVAQGL